jgi:hypothetical protein
MPESAEAVYARVLALVGEDGRLPTPPVTDWHTFPWEGEIVAKVVQPPVAEEPRGGEDGKPCWRCENPGANAIWHNERWQVTSMDRPSGLPVVLFLESREHMDFLDLDDDLAAEFGQVTAWLHRIMSNLPNVGRVHVCKWGDGNAHLHCWFMARTAGMAQTIGSYAAEWDEILPPVPDDIWRADLKAVADRLATHDGRALV